MTNHHANRETRARAAALRRAAHRRSGAAGIHKNAAKHPTRSAAKIALKKEFAR